VLGEVLAAAKAIGDEATRSSVLAALAPHLAPEQRPVALSEALAVAKAIDDAQKRSSALAALAPYLAPEQLCEVSQPPKPLLTRKHWSRGERGLLTRDRKSQMIEGGEGAK
jgi:hypothetical protein